jgi:hypothetical protein
MSKKRKMTLGDFYEGKNCPLCGIDLGYALEPVEAERNGEKILIPRVGISNLPNGMTYCKACGWFIRKVCY